jgi:hypothetical protein
MRPTKTYAHQQAITHDRKRKRKKKSKPSGLRKYWPHLTGKQAEAERQKLSDAQNACCAICKSPESRFKNRLAVDHNHKSGKVRGLLCYRCNKFRVGRQTIETCREVLDYLIKFDVPIKTV